MIMNRSSNINATRLWLLKEVRNNMRVITLGENIIKIIKLNKILGLNMLIVFKKLLWWRRSKM